MKAINIASFQDQLEIGLGMRQTRRRYMHKTYMLNCTGELRTGTRVGRAKFMQCLE